MQFKNDRPVTFQANGAMASRWRFVVLTAEQTVGYAGAGARALGVNMDTAEAAGDAVPVALPTTGPTIKIEAGAAVAAGARLAPDASGRAVAAGAAAAYSAIALSAATAAGDLIEAVLESGTAA